MRKQVMVRAWELAKQGTKKFGGKAVDFFVSALTIAWKEIKSHKLIKVVAPSKVAKLAEKFVDEMNRLNEKAFNTGKLTVEKINESTLVLNRFFETQSYGTVKAMMNDGNVRGQYFLIMRDYNN
jgi:hypothetical protein